MHVRAATPADAEAIARIYAAAIAARTSTFETVPPSADGVAARISSARPEHRWLVAEDAAAAVLGWAATTPYAARPAYDGVAGFSVYVDEAARGRGVGRALMGELLRQSAAAGLHKLTSRVLLANRASRALLRSAGFREVGVQRRHARLDGAWRDVVVVEALVGPALDDAVVEPPVLLRPFGVDDEDDAVAAHRELAEEDFGFLFRGDAEPWADHLARVERERRGEGLSEGWVPHTFLAIEADGVLVGRVSVRHALTPWLLEAGGHVGYAVRPGWRGRGFATAALRGALRVARGVGLERVLVTCHETNLASAAVIERCGGVLEDVRPQPDGPPKRRYWVEVPLR